MIGRIVITSVPRGLDGGAGFQPVLRTHALRPSIAERLAMRGAYPHPFPFGDPRNPRVHFHRIELVGDRAIHVLGSVRDAGGSYTGRSNHLAELIAIDPAETRGLPGGPAYAARSFPWLGRWTGEPRETPLAEESAVSGHDPGDPETTGRPAQCPAWHAITGDAGWAGELAKSFLDGKRALIWAGENIDVLELFVEALRLLPASTRWQVTFNTCEIEPFPAHWRAVRPELGLVGNYEPANELRLVLGKIRQNGSRAPDHDLSRRARGETVVHQSQPTTPASAREGEPPSADDAALRARLREISEERHRRASPGRNARDISSVHGPRSWLGVSILLGFVLFCITTIVTGVAINNRPDLLDWIAFRLGHSQPAELATEPLRTTSEQDKIDSDNEIARRNKIKHGEDKEKQDADARDQQQKKDAQAEQERKDAQTARERLAEEMRARSEEKRRELRGAQNKAIADLEKHSKSLSLLTEAFPGTLDNEAKPQQVVLSGSGYFDLPHLLSPTLELASPYATQDRLAIVEETTSLDDERTWKITGTVSFAGVPNPTDVGRIIARDKKLLLEPLVRGNNVLFTRLTNSVLLIRTLDPDGKEVPQPRCEIRFSLPLKRLQPIKISLLEDFPKLLGDEIAKRTKGIPKGNLQWAVSCSLQSSELFTWLHDSDLSREIRLPSPKAGDPEIEIKYLDFIHEAKNPKAKIVRERRGKIAVSGTLRLDPSKWEVVFDPSTELDELLADTPLFKSKITRDWLAEQVKQAKNLKNDEQSMKEIFAALFYEWLFGRLENIDHRNQMFDDFLKKQPKDYRVEDFKKFGDKHPSPVIFPIRSAVEWNNWKAVANTVPSPAGTNVPRPNGAGFEPKSQDAFDKEKDFLNELRTILDNIFDDFFKKNALPPAGDYVDRIKTEANQIGGGLAAVLCNDGFAPITVRLETLEVIALDRQDERYPIEIVKPDP